MNPNHQRLIEKAKKILKSEGFKEDQIHEDFGFKNHRVDVVGWSEDKKMAIECGDCDQDKLRDLRNFFDEVLCLPFEDRASRQVSFGSAGGLRVVLVRDDDVLFEMPLSAEDWSRDRLEDELASLEDEFNRFSKVFDALSHETRLKMMKQLLEDEDQTVSFAEFMHDLSLNPKIVWENAKKLSEGGLLEKVEKGRYRCSDFGQMEFMMSLALRRLIKASEEF